MKNEEFSFWFWFWFWFFWFFEKEVKNKEKKSEKYPLIIDALNIVGHLEKKFDSRSNSEKMNAFQEAFVLKRDEAYIGVLIDDLITKGTEEPYRMFTSRAEYRMLLRQDNADKRLTEKSHRIGLATKGRLAKMKSKYSNTNRLVKLLKNQSVSPKNINPILKKKKSAAVKQSGKADKILARPNISLSDLMKVKEIKEAAKEFCLTQEEKDQAEIQIKYRGYIDKERNNADKLNRLEAVRIPEKFDYLKIKSMSAEAKEKLIKIRPRTISQASRISGVSPNDISVLLVYMGR